jgi:serine phosphatase RsbU (regulator of sigma subunit)/ligand-binding sensor domain-containing protein
MRRILTVISIIIFSTALYAQINKFGVPTMKNYSTEVTQGSEYNWSLVKDKTGVLFVGNDNRGILRFDGHSWSKIPVRNDPSIRVLSISGEGVVYVGGSYEFGYIQPAGNGFPTYVSLSARFDEKKAEQSPDKKDSGNRNENKVPVGVIYSIVPADSVIYFASTISMFIYRPSTDSIDFINLRDYDLNNVIQVVKVGEKIIMADNVNGLFELVGRKPVRIPGGDFFSMKMNRVILPYGENSLFVGTVGHGVFTLDMNTGKVSSSVIDPALNATLMEDQLYTGLKTHSGETLLGTITNGIFVLDKNYKLIGKWDVRTTKMGNNAIAAIYLGDDPTSELWISTAGYITKAYIGQPIYEIPPEWGYEGLVNVLTYFDGRIYLTTDGGLFKSYVKQDGQLAFERAINNKFQYFTVIVGETGRESFLLAGSSQELFQLTKSGKVVNVSEVMKNSAAEKRSGFYVRSLLQSQSDRKRFYIGLNSGGVIISEYENGTWKFVNQIKKGFEGYISSMIEDKNGDLLVFTGNPIGIFRMAANDTLAVMFTAEDGIANCVVTGMSQVGNEIVLTTSKGLLRYNAESKKWSSYNELLGGYTKDKNCNYIFLDKDEDIWLTINEDRIYEMLFKKDSVSYTAYKSNLNALPNLDKYGFRYLDGKYYMTKNEVIYVIDKEKLTLKQPDLRVLLSKVAIGTDSLLMNGTFYETLPDGKNVAVFSDRSESIPEIEYNYNSVSFFWTLPQYIEEESTLFRYKLEGFDKGWSKWEKTYYKDFTNLPFGKYTLKLQAKTLNDQISEETSFDFYVLKPWYLKAYMIILYTVVIVLVILLIIKAYTRKLKNENVRLEGIVAERTAVVVKQKEELESSIHYASRIQMALLPSEEILSENLKNYFILFKPRDIVSGDFYWMSKKANRLYIVAADCTGHGVPGAFMSLLGMSFLDEIIDKEKAARADHILNELRHHVTESLKQSGSDNEAKDGMDMSLLVIDFNVSRVEFSGAYNPCFRIRRLTDTEIRDYKEDGLETQEGSMSDGKYLLETIYASKMPIGISPRMDEKFVFFDWELEKGVSYYLFSDGYLDQFGGQNGKKFMKKNFKRYLLEIQDYPMNRQKELLDKNLKEWMGHSPQIDDILVMGIRTD